VIIDISLLPHTHAQGLKELVCRCYEHKNHQILNFTWMTHKHDELLVKLGEKLASNGLVYSMRGDLATIPTLINHTYCRPCAFYSYIYMHNLTGVAYEGKGHQITCIQQLYSSQSSGLIAHLCCWRCLHVVCGDAYETCLANTCKPQHAAVISVQIAADVMRVQSMCSKEL
jgi:hypothetical protein